MADSDLLSPVCSVWAVCMLNGVLRSRASLVTGASLLCAGYSIGIAVKVWMWRMCPRAARRMCAVLDDANAALHAAAAAAGAAGGVQCEWRLGAVLNINSLPDTIVLLLLRCQPLIQSL